MSTSDGKKKKRIYESVCEEWIPWMDFLFLPDIAIIFNELHHGNVLLLWLPTVSLPCVVNLVDSIIPEKAGC